MGTELDGPGRARQFRDALQKVWDRHAAATGDVVLMQGVVHRVDPTGAIVVRVSDPLAPGALEGASAVSDAMGAPILLEAHVTHTGPCGLPKRFEPHRATIERKLRDALAPFATKAVSPAVLDDMARVVVQIANEHARRLRVAPISPADGEFVLVDDPERGQGMRYVYRGP